MNIQSIVDAFGHPSESDQVDNILEHFKCKKRPKGDESLIQIDSADRDLCFRFSSAGTYREDVPEGPKGDGWYILRAVDVEAKYKGEPPYGMHMKMDGDAMAGLLGTPSKQKAGNQIFHREGTLVVVRFTNEKYQRISSIGFSIKDKYHAKNYGI